jgi:hypothetical protein
MAREAENEKVRLGVVSSAQHGDPVVDLQLALGPWYSTDLAAAAPGFDQA